MTSEETKEALVAEQRHQYRDLDPDSECCPDGFTCPACPPADGDKERR